METLLQTPLYSLHLKAKAKMVPFAGYSMPVQYTGIKLEHSAVRQNAGIFDVSHMGNILVSGPRSLDFLQKLTVNDVSKLKPLDVQYSAFCYENGTVLDDILVTCLEPQAYHVVVNASNIEKCWDWMQKHHVEGVTLENKSKDLAIIALQGPKALAIAQKITEGNLSLVGRYKAGHSKVAGKEIVYSRTGYTGEDGFEFFPKSDHAEEVWNSLVEAGKEWGLSHCGLASRDSLRIEAGYSLYGHEINENYNLIEAGLGWIVSFSKGDFMGRQALLEVKNQGPSRKIVGLTMTEKAIPREGYTVHHGSTQVGFITSGTLNPSNDQGIAMAYIQSEFSQTGTFLEVEIRGQRKTCKVGSRNFYTFPKI